MPRLDLLSNAVTCKRFRCSLRRLRELTVLFLLRWPLLKSGLDFAFLSPNFLDYMSSQLLCAGNGRVSWPEEAASCCRHSLWLAMFVPTRREPFFRAPNSGLNVRPFRNLAGGSVRV
ncbi:hypothetical protein Nepgr_018220 [Nepenthes gracilis]|uniref:Uncharacterized protein n=1 Tax=Nepenthes gracilis TaxID=150966 RepID=A0AAD3XTU1_NEPGR|nr:hypothetical protein Nepgr_018220 [Nepenthes gracilis]